MEILSRSAVSTAVAGIKTSAKALQQTIHQVAVSTLDHAREDGDYRGALALVNALPNGQRVQGLIAWYQHFSNGKLKFRTDKENGGYACSILSDRTDEDFNIEGASEIDFGSFTKEPKTSTFTVDKLIKMLETKANNTEVNADGTDKVSPEARAVAAQLVAAYRKAAASVTIQ